MKIEPRVGLDQVKFGLSRDGLKEILGEPGQVIAHDHEGGTSTEAWYYWDKGVSFHFDTESEWRLVLIETSSPEAMLKGSKVIGQSRKDLCRLMRRKRVEWDEDETGLIYCPAWDMNVWFKDDLVESLQWEVRIDEETDKYLWP